MKVTIFLTGFLLSATTINAYAMSCSKEGGGVSETTLSLKDNGVLIKLVIKALGRICQKACLLNLGHFRMWMQL
jgi:hypothetical protein